jgi:DNA-binding LytR/AlgR family response regulator
MNCIVIDDEPLARQGMQMHIKKMPILQLLGSFSNPLDASSTLKENRIDIIFLDINMPEISGLEYVKTLVNSPLIIFATAYPQHALDSYELDAIDYLLKPIRFERFVKAVNKAQNYLDLLDSKKDQKHQIESVSSDFIFIKADRKIFKIAYKDILYIEGLKDYVIIHTQERKVITALNLKTIFDQLPSSLFVRISKSYIVNTLHIISFDTYNVYLSKVELPLGTNFKDEFMKIYLDETMMK